MKKLVFSFLILGALQVQAQDHNSEIKPAAKGVVYGEELSTSGQAISASDIQAKMNNGVYEGKITGKVTEVCKAMGCWIRVEKADGSSLMVKTKDHAFFLPQNLVGKTVEMEGTASVKEVSEEKRKHFAEDAGKSKAEIKKIKGAEKEVQFIASGVKVLD
jgi:hypothetical protein